MGLLKDLGILDDFGEIEPWFNVFLCGNPFLLDERNELFGDFLTKLKEYVNLCGDELFWELQSYEDRQKAISELKQKKKSINQVLKNLIPKGAGKRRKKQFLKTVRFKPELFIWAIHMKNKQIESWLEKYTAEHKYKEKPELYDIYVESEQKIDLDHITIEYRSITTVSISLLAYYANVSFDALYPIYTDIGAKKRKDIIDNPSKYFPPI